MKEYLQDKVFIWIVLSVLFMFILLFFFNSCVTQTVNIGSPQHNPEVEIDPVTEIIKNDSIR